MPFTPEEAKTLNTELMECLYQTELTETKNKIDNQLKCTPSGTHIDSLKKVLDTLSQEYQNYGWYCRQYTKSYFHMEINYLEISATPFIKNAWKERVLNFLNKL